MGLGWVFLEVSASKGDVGQGRCGGEQSPVHALLLRESKSPAGMPCWPLSHTVLGSALKIGTNHPKHPHHHTMHKQSCEERWGRILLVLSPQIHHPPASLLPQTASPGARCRILAPPRAQGCPSEGRRAPLPSRPFPQPGHNAITNLFNFTSHQAP